MKVRVKAARKKLMCGRAQQGVFAGHVPVIPNEAVGARLQRIVKAFVKCGTQGFRLGKKSIEGLVLHITPKKRARSSRALFH
jgi:hypothetical protein